MAARSRSRAAASAAARRSPSALSEIGFARICDRRVRQHVDERRLAGRECALECRSQVIRATHELAVPAERLDELVVARPLAQLGRNRVAVEKLHRMLLETPDAVV